MSINTEELYNLISKSFPNEKIELIDTVGDNNHYKLSIISKKFEGLSKVMRHQMIYNALGNLMHNKLHALSISTIAPSEIK